MNTEHIDPTIEALAFQESRPRLGPGDLHIVAWVSRNTPSPDHPTSAIVAFEILGVTV